MRRALATLVSTLAVIAVLAAPALAKDPFDPVVTSQDLGTGTTQTITETTTSGQPAVIGVPPDATSESMPLTGSDVSPWLVLSYALLVAGGAAIVVARSFRPARI